MGRFKKGVMIGGLMGAAFMWLSTTKKGREMRDQMVDHAADIYSDLKAKVTDPELWRHMSESKYVAMVQETVDKYAARHPLTQKMRDAVVKILASQWKHIERDMKIKHANGKRGNGGR